MKCSGSNYDKGCKWTGELGALKTHLESDKGCGFVEVACPNRCTNFFFVVRVQRMDLDKHLKTECALRQYQCEHCGHKDTYKDITGYLLGQVKGNSGHYLKCPEFPLTCPNKCGAMSIKRKNMNSHRSECPQEPVQCPFAEAGCKDHLRRRQLEDHMTSSVQQHLLLVMNDYKKVKERLRKTEAKLRETEAKLEELTTKTRK